MALSRLPAALAVLALVLSPVCAAATAETAPSSSATQTSASSVTYEEAFTELYRVLGRQYPCFEMKGIDWKAVGDRLLPRAKEVATDEEFGLLCLELVARLEDSHAALSAGTAQVPSVPFPQWDPGLACLIDDRGVPVIYHVDENGPACAAGVRPGMTVALINGKVALEALDEIMERTRKYFSYSSERYLRYHAAQWLGRQMDQGDMVALVLDDVDGAVRTFELPATMPVRYLPRLPVPIEGIRDSADVAWKMLDDGIGYIYVRRIRENLIASLDSAVGELKDAKGIIVDVRGNSGGGFDASRAFRNFDMADTAEPNRPRFGGPMAVLIDARCISAGEGWASWFVARKRARFFGETTAGASSAKTTYTLKNGMYKVTFPVRPRVGFLDRPIERRGLEPDVPLRQNAADLAAGRDTVLEAAKAYLIDVAGEPVGTMPAAEEEAVPLATQEATTTSSESGTREVSGTVVDADGNAVSGAEVTLYPYQAYGECDPVTVATADDGRFTARMPVSPEVSYNACLVVARRSGSVAIRSPHWFEGAPSFDEAKMTLVPADGFVSGRLVDEKGKAVRDASAIAWVIRPDASPARGRSVYLPSFPKFQRLFTTESDRNGAFTLEDLPRGCVVIVSLYKKGRAMFLERLAADGVEKTVVMPREAEISGRVVARGGDLPLGGLIVLFRTLDSQFVTESVSDTMQTETSRTGRFSFGALAAGDVIVAVAHSSLTPPWTCVPSNPLKLEAGKTAKVTIELVKGVKVSGRITDKATGEALPGGWVIAAPQAGRVVSIPSDACDTDEEGKYTLYLAPGKHWLQTGGRFTHASAPTSQERQITVEEGRELEGVDFELEIGPRAGN